MGRAGTYVSGSRHASREGAMVQTMPQRAVMVKMRRKQQAVLRQRGAGTGYAHASRLHAAYRGSGKREM